MSNPFAFLKTTNDWLESVPERATKALDNAVGNGEKIAQSKVDSICVWLSWKINIQIERVRQSVIRTLHGMYKSTMAGKVMKMAKSIQSLVSDPLGALGSFASTLFSPVSSVFNWVKTLVKEVPRLAENLANIASSLPPTPPSPNINYYKFKIKVKSISLSAITSDPSKLPSPESMFPEPPNPFTKNTFQETFSSMNSKLKSNQVIYKLTDKQKQSLAQMNTSDIDSLSFEDISDLNKNLDNLSFN